MAKNKATIKIDTNRSGKNTLIRLEDGIDIFTSGQTLN
jgi:hypothetical protein